MAQIGIDQGNYSFDASLGTITFSGVTISTIEQIKIVNNVAKGVVIFNPVDPSKLGTLSTNVLTLDADTSTMTNGDELFICVNLGDSDPATETTLAAIKAKTDLLTFTSDKLKTTGEDGGGGNGVVGLKDIEGNQINPTKLETQENALLFIKRTENVLVSLLEQQKITNKYLRKIVSNE